MCKPHKHAAVIRAFADGHKIQHKHYNSEEWHDWDDQYCPSFLPDLEYRVKPKKKKYEYYIIRSKIDGFISTAPGRCSNIELNWEVISPLLSFEYED